MERRAVIRSALAAGASTALAGVAGPAWAAKPPPPPGPRNIAYQGWTSDADFGTGAHLGTATSGGALRIASAAGQFTYLGSSYDYASWTSPMVATGFPATEAIASWTADTPGATWVQVELRGVTAAGNTSAWKVMGRWAAEDTTVQRTSVPGQTDADGGIAIDTWTAAAGHALTSWQARVTLYRPAGGSLTPVVRSLGAVASAVAGAGTPTVPGAAQGVTLNVPQYSQEIHAGQYPQYNGGGEAWCSPTSTSMVVAFWGAGPTPADYAWVNPSYADPWVDHAARSTYDLNYDGTGNWPFNTAYAGRFGLDGFVTRLRSLNEAEKFIAAGIPLVLSLSFSKNEIPGLSYSTNGHLLVLVGFSATGQPVLNDPASATNAAVRKTVGRADFEAAWLRSSGGVVYVIKQPGVALPTPPTQANW
ncbi:C39 family peptidase [Catellatospora vulcania]|uniref:C39 family peptidase n=1 Tax=Catellatospora vulcania TaxID=1460450 RepID=UPI0012D42EC5|nr:C39 family peptidase [Catellatospora vulcania]